MLLHRLSVLGTIDHDNTVATPDLACIPMALSVPCLDSTSKPDVFHDEPIVVRLRYNVEAEWDVVCPPERE